MSYNQNAHFQQWIDNADLSQEERKDLINLYLDKNISGKLNARGQKLSYAFILLQLQAERNAQLALHSGTENQINIWKELQV